MSSSSPPDTNEYHSFYETYVQQVPAGNILELMDGQIEETRSLLAELPDIDADTLHPPYTWTIKQVVGHLIDAEKIFGCRAHRFACLDQQPVPGMNQNDYVEALDYVDVKLLALIDELESTRKSNLAFLRRLPANAFDRVGTADGNPVTVRALAHIIFGHVAYHLKIVRKRLGIE